MGESESTICVATEEGCLESPLFPIHLVIRAARFAFSQPGLTFDDEGCNVGLQFLEFCVIIRADG